VIKLTPAGTTNDCAAPVIANEHVTTLEASEQPAGNAADAEPANATAHNPNNPAVATNNPTARPRTLRRPHPALRDPEENISISDL
jgi:hypothetical protein